MDFASIRDSLPDMIKGAIVGAIATMFVGFYFAGWTLGSTAERQVKEAEQAGIVRVLAPICVDKFEHSVDVTANMDALKKADSWKRDEMIEKAGWTKFPGSEPDRKVAEACATMLGQIK
jgi:hypothetical protein